VAELVPVAPKRLRLPPAFTPTHETAGLAGFPAVDLFAAPRTEVVADFYGVVVRISGRRCCDGGSPGGAYGQSVYITNRGNGYERYATHFDRLFVTVGQRISPGSRIGTVCDSAVTGKPGTSHVHLGMRRPALAEAA
jgi:murein DD-endopeptidase MepM/ murein hydrolase activator NlpD